MIVYFADRDLNLTGHASTALPGGFRIVNDVTTEDVETGVNKFSCTLGGNDSTFYELQNRIKVGQFILKSADENAEGTYDSLYQIIETETDTETLELVIYAEDAGLDLLNKVVGETILTNKTISQMMNYFIPGDWSLNLVDPQSGTKTNEWDGENTLTERINSVAGLWGCEVYYSFMIENFEITKKIINVVNHRGSEEATIQLRLGKNISKITTQTSISNLATAFAVTGGTPDGTDVPINLRGYSYSYTDPVTGDRYVVDGATGQVRNLDAMSRWASALDTDGLIVKSYSFDTTNKAVLAGQARAELQKVCQPEVNYECDFVNLRGAKIGDRVNIIDEQGEFYLEARLLKLETSVSEQTQKATIGEYLLKSSGISPEVMAFASEFSQKVKNGINGTAISISSSGGNIFHNKKIQTVLVATVFFGEKVITNQTDLETNFGNGALLNWYNSQGEAVNSGFTLSVDSENQIEKYVVRLVT